MLQALVRKFMVPTFVVAVLANASDLFAQTGGLTGTAMDEKGSPLVGYRIRIERKSIRGTYMARTNKRGTYIFLGLPEDDYDISLVHPVTGMRGLTVSTRVVAGDPTVVDFDMSRASKTPQMDPEANLGREVEPSVPMSESERFTALKSIFDRGNLSYQQGKYAEAAATFEEGVPLAKDKNLPVLLARTADSYAKAKQFKKAVNYYEKAVALAPTDTNLRNRLEDARALLAGTPEASPSSEAPVELKEGQTPEEVENILGKPEDSTAVDETLIYTYPTVKVIFKSRKLVDVQERKR